jgi:hypothetical protein
MSPGTPLARPAQAVGKLKRFKRIALRCEKTAQNYGSFIALALGFILVKSVHTAKVCSVRGYYCAIHKLIWTLSLASAIFGQRG